MGQLTKAILTEAELRIADGVDHYICHAVARAAGEPLGTSPEGSVRREAEQLLEKLGIDLSGDHFSQVGVSAGYNKHGAYGETVKAWRYGRALILRVMQSMVAE